MYVNIHKRYVFFYRVNVRYMFLLMVFFFFKQKTAYEMLRSLVGSEMCIRDRDSNDNPQGKSHQTRENVLQCDRLGGCGLGINLFRDSNIMLVMIIRVGGTLVGRVCRCGGNGMRFKRLRSHYYRR
eukprot:TRINITY_DN33869_c0_g1_i2.p2 TRINITY_DN33869_c0_g1~~TRINITY_DN33869_c0_g1_i2.p2  ORF type:complete len:126 (+),score=14.61 TRINITY_DN33869_c0_g1_i2:5-382(+)